MKVFIEERNGRIVNHTIDGIDQLGLGDKIADNPIINAIGRVSGCIDPETKQLKKDSGCNKMKERLNGGMSVSEAMKLRWQGK